MIEHYIDLILDNLVTSTSILLVITGLLIFFFLLIGSFNSKFLGIKTRKTQSRISERRLISIATYFTSIGSAFLIIIGLMASTNTSSILSINDWRGKWVVSLEEMGCFKYSDVNDYELVIDFSDGKALGILYNQHQKVVAHLSSIKSEENHYMYGKIGHLDGRKMKFEFTMERGGKNFTGKYKHRHRKDDWKLWKGKKVE